MDKKLIIVGLSNNARLAKYFFEEDTAYKVAAFAVNKEYLVEEYCDLPVVAVEEMATIYPPSEYDAFIAVGYTNMNDVRQKLYTDVKALGYTLPNYISSKCSFLTKEPIGDNNLILEDNTIQPFVKIGSNNVLWSGNHIGHDTVIGDHCFITSHVVVSGFCKIGNNSFLGVNATLRDDITIGEYSLLGAGVSIMHDTDAYSVYLPPKPFKMDKKSTDLKIS